MEEAEFKQTISLETLNGKLCLNAGRQWMQSGLIRKEILSTLMKAISHQRLKRFFILLEKGDGTMECIET